MTFKAALPKADVWRMGNSLEETACPTELSTDDPQRCLSGALVCRCRTRQLEAGLVTTIRRRLLHRVCSVCVPRVELRLPPTVQGRAHE
jgi:hypothetical protein